MKTISNIMWTYHRLRCQDSGIWPNHPVFWYSGTSGPVDNFTQNWTGKTPVLYTAFIWRHSVTQHLAIFSKILSNNGSFSGIKTPKSFVHLSRPCPVPTDAALCCPSRLGRGKRSSHCPSPSTHLASWCPVQFLFTRHYASVGTSHGPMSVCHKSVFCQTDGRNNLGFGVGASFDQSYAVLRKFMYLQK